MGTAEVAWDSWGEGEYNVLISRNAGFWQSDKNSKQAWTCATHNMLIDALLTPIVDSTYLNIDMWNFESSLKDESRAQSTDSSKVYRNLLLLTIVID